MYVYVYVYIYIYICALNYCHQLTKPEGNEQIMEVPIFSTEFAENCIEKN